MEEIKRDKWRSTTENRDIPVEFHRGVFWVGSEGRYWSSTPVGPDYAGRLHIDSTHVNVRVDMRKNGLSVRLVKK